MALRMYKDASCTQEVTAGSPDTVRQAVTSGQTLNNEVALWIKSDDNTLTYENISLTALNDYNGTSTSGQIDVMYAPDSAGSAGTYVQSLSIANQDFGTAYKFWRKVTSPNVTSAFNVTNIQHQITADEYLK